MAASEATTRTRGTGRALPRRVTLLALSSVLALSLGSGIFALLQDSVLNPGYSFESGTYQPPSGVAFDLQVAVPTLGQPCTATSLTWTDGPIAAVLDNASIDLQLDEVAPHSERVCLRNNTDNPGALWVTVTNLVDSEVGACAPSEADFDATCTDGAAGELSDIVLMIIGGHPWNLNGWASAPRPIDTWAAGWGVWEIGFGAGLPMGLTPEEKLAAQTDRVTFDLVFTLQDRT
jgi:hypothetical protein